MPLDTGQSKVQKQESRQANRLLEDSEVPAGFKCEFRPTGSKPVTEIRYGEVIQLAPNQFLKFDPIFGVSELLIDGKLYLATKVDPKAMLTASDYTVGVFELSPDPDYKAPASSLLSRIRSKLVVYFEGKNNF